MDVTIPRVPAFGRHIDPAFQPYIARLRTVQGKVLIDRDKLGPFAGNQPIGAGRQLDAEATPDENAARPLLPARPSVSRARLNPPLRMDAEA